MKWAVPVLTETVQIPVPDGAPMSAYLARPKEGNPMRAVIVGMELFGVSAHVRDVCERLAVLGYVAIAPDLYHRVAPHIELAADDEGRTRGFTLLHQLTRRGVLTDIDATINRLREHHLTLAGMVGLSVGGHIAYLAATELAIPATVVIYGGWIPTTDIPISQPEPTLASTPGITGTMLLLVGDRDIVVPLEHRRAITAALESADVEHELVEYRGVGHGFMCERRDGYHYESAEDAWNRIEQFLARTMDPSTQTPD